MIGGPGWADFAALGGKLALDLCCGVAEVRSDAFFEVTFPDAFDGKIADVAGFGENFAEELAFGGVKQRMRGQDFGERRERAA